MSTTVGRFITVASMIPELLRTADAAGPSLRKGAAIGVEVTGMMKDPALQAFAKVVQKLVTDLDLGGVVPPADVVTPAEAIKQIAAGNVTPEQQQQLEQPFDRNTQLFG